ncbi:MAG: RidA family protein [bacterium]|nr:RidA family protein [bacterium]
MPRQYFEGPATKSRGFSAAVVTKGGRIVWLAGFAPHTDENGNSLAGDFIAQADATFRRMAKVMEQAGGTLEDVVTMEVFVTDTRLSDRFVEVRKKYFPSGNYPSSALITVAGLDHPDMLIEIKGIGVIGDE